MMMKKCFVLLGLTLALACTAKAQTPPAEKLLPSDTLVLLTVPDLDKTRGEIKANPASQLYNEASMQPFINKFLGKWNSEIVAPLEKELGVKFADYLALAKGQFTIAVVRDGWEGQKGQEPGVILLIDSKDKSKDLENKITELRKRWTDSGKQVKTEKVRDVDFYTVLIPQDELDKSFSNAFPSAKKKADADDGDEKKSERKPVEVTIGRSGSLFLMGNSKRVFEKVLIKQSGGSLPGLDEVPNYQGAHEALFRDSMFNLWVNFQTFYDIGMKDVAAKSAQPQGGPDAAMAMPSVDKIMDALGIRGLKTFAMSGRLTSDGSFAQFQLGVPKDQRKGIFQILTPEQKDSAPPAFVPADATKFMRWRLNGQKLWATLENTIASISPQMGGLLQMTLGAAGKDKDPNFDLKKQLIGNLGDDVISYEKPPTGSSLEELSAPPSIVLIGSPNADQFLSALRIGTGFLIPPGGSDTPAEREFLGKKIYTLAMPGGQGLDGKRPKEKAIHYVSSGGYVAFSLEPGMVEEYVRSAQGGVRPLSETPGLAEAAQKVGGMSSGLLVYENQTTTARIVVNALRKNPEMFDVLFAAGGSLDDEAKKRRAEWLDFSLLPEFSAIEKYFHFAVTGYTSDDKGMTYNFFSPTPPKAK